MQHQHVASQALLRAERAERPLGKTTGAASNVRAADVGRALRYAKAPRPPAARPQPTVTFLIGGNSDISKWWTQNSRFTVSFAVTVTWPQPRLPAQPLSRLPAWAAKGRFSGDVIEPPPLFCDDGGVRHGALEFT
jgi:hypothetical protein